MSVLVSAVSFIVAVGLLVTVHEFGHYWIAKKLGVKVLRFSIGFGRPLWKRSGRDGTEYVVATIPLGGYVKMLDEREGEVPASERERAFNRKPVASRIAIVAAGPAFNFLFAILAYWLMFVHGVSGMKPVIGVVDAGSLAAKSGFQAGDQILEVNGKRTPTWDVASITLIEQALETDTPLTVEVEGVDGGRATREFDLGDRRRLLSEGSLLDKLGMQPWRPIVDVIVGELVPGGAADQGGLQPGDHIVAANGRAVNDWTEWVGIVRAHPERALELEVERSGQVLEMTLVPEARQERGETIGQIGVYPFVDESAIESMRVVVRYGLVEALGQAGLKTWDMSALTLRVLWKLVLGEASLRNISGPISIAEYAGISAVIGLSAFLAFLSIVSISLGILNLLPVPVLDGGHLLYYVIELVKGSPVSEKTEAFGQRIGVAMLAALMALAFYNDLTRLFG